MAAHKFFLLSTYLFSFLAYFSLHKYYFTLFLSLSLFLAFFTITLSTNVPSSHPLKYINLFCRTSLPQVITRCSINVIKPLLSTALSSSSAVVKILTVAILTTFWEKLEFFRSSSNRTRGSWVWMPGC